MFRRNRHILYIILVASSAVGLVLALAMSTVKQSYQKNGFKRVFTKKKVFNVNSLVRDKSVLDIVGATNTRLYFKTNLPERILVATTDLKDTNYIHLSLKYNKWLASSFDYVIDSPDVKIFAGNVPCLVYANLNDDSVKTFLLPTRQFTRAIKLSPNSFVFRGFDSSTKSADQIFLKSYPQDNIILKERNISERHNDAGISTDGMLHYDTTTHRIVYIHFYRNEFLCLDTNLSLIYKANTIDTINHQRLFASKTMFGDKEAYTNVTPKRITNRLSCTDSGLLFVNSGVMSDNEIKSDFFSNSVIDIYNVVNGQYLGSFYVPFIEGKKPFRFKVYRGHLIALYDRQIVTFKLLEVK